MSSEKLDALREESELLDVDVVMRYIRILSELSNQIKYATQKRVLIEIALIKMMQPAMELDYESLKNRVSNIEKKLENGILVKDDSAGMHNPSVTGVAGGQNAGATEIKKLEVAVPEEIQKVAENWQAIVRNIGGHLGVCIKRSKLSIDENSILCIVYDSSIDWQQDNKKENIELIQAEIAKAIQKEVRVDLRCVQPQENYNDSYMALDIGDINFEVENIDDENEEEEDF
ncbi:MAG: hypothetical protein IJA27_06360, partial [Lachnospiraceae bacterium]|nr:hypothetical protein [Lachnospiraceae bacterium]